MSDNERAKMLSALQDVFRDVFDNDKLIITEQTSAADIDEWDSLMHISLIVAVEKKFNMRLDAAKIASFANVGGMVDVLLGKHPM